ncbi:MAG TPA: efflux RND transporter permease subunit [Coxiellaceae bacterium]|nr:efflux RND transporter permease subunit [Coxiellaceae bacterium]
MKTFTDLFIKRPVLAMVVSLMIFLLGLRAIFNLPLQQYPTMENTVITVTTTYAGASAELMAGFITSPLERAIATADGIDYLTASSTDGLSTIQANIRLNYDPDKAFTNIMSKVSEVEGELPPQSQQPVIEKETGQQVALMYLSYTSKIMNNTQITDYMNRVVQPKLNTIPGVSEAQILGGETFAMRIWLDPFRMAAVGVTPADVAQALQNNNFQTAAGSTKGRFTAVSINASTDLHSEEEFKNLVIKSVNGSLVHLKEVAQVSLGAEQYDSSVVFNGERAVFIGIKSAPTANPLNVASQVRKELPFIAKAFPSDLKQKIVYDGTRFIQASIEEVIKTLLEASVIVVIVILLFLGSLRTVIIPVITIPLSLIGVCSLLLMMNYSLNLLTLLAMVLAIGLVVDDAIVVVENIYRHVEAGIPPFQAALKGAREIAMPIIAMTLTLAAVYAPIGFMSGITGSLFKEFAFALAGAVIVSGIIALTLSPMMCSKFFNTQLDKNRYVHFINATFLRMQIFYEKRLTNVIRYRPIVLVFTAIVLISCYFLYTSTKSELAPTEDKGVLFMVATAPEYANIEYTQRFTHQFEKIFQTAKNMSDYFVVNGMSGANSAFAGIILKPWSERTQSQAMILNDLQGKINQVAGLETAIFPLPALPSGTNSMPVYFVLTSVNDYKILYDVAEKLVEKAQQSGRFLFISSDLQYNKPEIQLDINRGKAGQMGVNMSALAAQLSTALSGAYVNYFSMMGQSYDVIPQLARQYRLEDEDLKNIYIKTGEGKLIALSTIADINHFITPNSLPQFQQLNSISLTGVMGIGQSLGETLDYLKAEADKLLPEGVSYDFGGQSRQFFQEGSALVVAFIFSLIVIFLVLSAQFESFRDPLIILISVPMSICGALIPLNVLQGTVNVSINIYTQIGLISLIGLISKHGILIVEFANQLQEREGLSIQEAVIKAAGIRLRPVLMTTAAMVVGVLPLIMAQGPGAVSRMNIGIVIASGMLIGTLFTLFVLPTLYTYIAEKKVAQANDLPV